MTSRHAVGDDILKEWGGLEAIWIKRAHRAPMDAGWRGRAFAKVLNDGEIYVGDAARWG